MYMIKNMGWFTYSKCRVPSLLWLAHFGMRSCTCAQLLSSSHLVDHTSIPLIFQVNLIGQRFVSGDKAWPFLMQHFLQLLYSKHPKELFMPIPPFKIAHFPCFKILWTNPILTSKFVNENSTTNIE